MRPGEPQDPDRRDRGLCDWVEVLGAAEELPLPVFGEVDYPEETRLTYRFLDLRRDKMHQQHDAAVERGALAAGQDVGSGVQRIPDADHHRLQPRRRARLSGAVAACIRASSMPCRRRRSSSSS
jgi:hypothetical protein